MEPPSAKGRPQGRLLVSTSLDAKDELEERLDRCVGIVSSMIGGLSEREANDALTAHVCKGSQQHEEVCLGLFTLLLTEPTQAQRCYRDLTLVNRDGMNIVLMKINQILMEKFLKVQDICRTQLVWLVRELVKSGVIGADGVCMTLMKQIAGGDISNKNIWLAENVLDILVEQREWVMKSSMLIAMSVYTYLRLIVDHHGSPPLLALRQREVDFCIGLLREKFMDCFIIGRDLVRLLQNVARIPEMDLLWRDLLHNPQGLSPQFTGLSVCPLSSQSTGRKLELRISATDGPMRLLCPVRVAPLLECFHSLCVCLTSTLSHSHLAPLFDNPKLDRELRAMLRDRFPEFCSSPSPPVEVKMDESVSLEMENHVSDKEDGCYDNTEAAFSDDEEELNNKGRESKHHRGGAARDTEAQCEVMQEIVDLILEEDFDSEQMSALASCLAELFKGHFRGDVLPEEITEESLEESVCKPVCLIFRNLCQMQEDNSGFSVLLDMLAELYQKQPKIGYHLLYYLKASKAAVGRMSLYESFAQATALGDLHTCLMMDMKACQEDDIRLLCYLTPSIYSEVCLSVSLSLCLSHYTVLYPTTLYCAPHTALYPTLCCLSLHVLMSTVPALAEHPEALSCLLLQLRREKPSEEMVKMVLSRPCHPEDQFTTSILRHWAAKHDDLLAEHIKALLIKNNSLPRKRQSLRSSSSKLAQLTLEQILEHLDNLRLSLSNTKHNFFSQTPILQALQHVQASCDEAHKMRFSDLFSLAEEYEDSSSKPPKSRRKAAVSSPRSRKGAAPPASNEEESGSSSASEEEDSKPKAPKRKRKGSSAVGSDSD
nr:PREDICTED: integrator complex subunit 3 [Lepisosteus oculatus]